MIAKILGFYMSLCWCICLPVCCFIKNLLWWHITNEILSLFVCIKLHVCVCVSCVTLVFVSRSQVGVQFIPLKVINLWLFRATLLGLIGDTSKNSVHHDEQIDEDKDFCHLKKLSKHLIDFQNFRKLKIFPYCEPIFYP